MSDDTDELAAHLADAGDVPMVRVLYDAYEAVTERVGPAFSRVEMARERLRQAERDLAECLCEQEAPLQAWKDEATRVRIAREAGSDG